MIGRYTLAPPHPDIDNFGERPSAPTYFSADIPGPLAMPDR